MTALFDGAQRRWFVARDFEQVQLSLAALHEPAKITRPPVEGAVLSRDLDKAAHNLDLRNRNDKRCNHFRSPSPAARLSIRLKGIGASDCDKAMTRLGDNAYVNARKSLGLFRVGAGR